VPLNSTRKTHFEQVAKPTWVLGADGEPAGVAFNPFQTQLVDASGNPYGAEINPLQADLVSGVQLVDENGLSYGVKHIDNKPRVSSMDYLYDIAEGNVPDHVAIHHFGHNTSVAVAIETIYHVSNLRTYLTAAERLQIASTAGADDSGGTGARTLIVNGLDANYDILVETITMNGGANVLTDASFLRVADITVATAGATGYNEGIITISDNADAIILDQIEIRENKSHCACYTTPNGHTTHIVNAFATESSSKGCLLSLWVRQFGGLWTMERGVQLLDSTIVIVFPMPLTIPQKADMEIRGEAILAGANVTAGFDGWVEVN